MNRLLLRQYRLGLMLVVGLLLYSADVIFAVSHSAIADNYERYRAEVGIKLFRTLLSANLDLVNTADLDRLVIIVLFDQDENTAESYRNVLAESLATLHDRPVTIQTESIATWQAASQASVAAIFISEELTTQQRQALIDTSIQRRLMLFSPFEGDVEAGVLAGLSVQATIRPLLNMQTLKLGSFHIKPFYLKVAKHYE